MLCLLNVMLHVIILSVIILNVVGPLGQAGWQNGKLLVLGHFVNVSFSQHGILATPKSVFQFGKEYKLDDAVGATTLSIMTLSITTFRIMTLSTKGLHGTLSLS
jgi:hypothetical protein